MGVRKNFRGQGVHTYKQVEYPISQTMHILKLLSHFYMRQFHLMTSIGCNNMASKQLGAYLTE